MQPHNVMIVMALAAHFKVAARRREDNDPPLQGVSGASECRTKVVQLLCLLQLNPQRKIFASLNAENHAHMMCKLPDEVPEAFPVEAFGIHLRSMARARLFLEDNERQRFAFLPH